MTVLRFALIGLLVAGACAVAFLILQGQGVPRVDLGRLDTDDLALPRAYAKFDEPSGKTIETALDWSLIESGRPTGSPCGEEVAWVWAHRSQDPKIRLYVCSTASADRAAAILRSVPLEETFVPSQVGIYELQPVPVASWGLVAEDAQVACAWGPPDDCRGWIFGGRYGAYLVNLQFAVAGHGGGIHQEAFEQLVISVDDLMDESLNPPGD